MLDGVLPKPQAVSTLLFRQIPSGVSVDWHNPPRRLYAVHLDGRAQTTASNGEARVLGAGEVMPVEDTTGEGHQAKTLEAAAFRAILYRSTNDTLGPSSQRPERVSGDRVAHASTPNETPSRRPAMDVTLSPAKILDTERPVSGPDDGGHRGSRF